MIGFTLLANKFAGMIDRDRLFNYSAENPALFVEFFELSRFT